MATALVILLMLAATVALVAFGDFIGRHLAEALRGGKPEPKLGGEEHNRLGLSGERTKQHFSLRSHFGTEA